MKEEIGGVRGHRKEEVNRRGGERGIASQAERTCFTHDAQGLRRLARMERDRVGTEEEEGE